MLDLVILSLIVVLATHDAAPAEWAAGGGALGLALGAGLPIGVAIVGALRLRRLSVRLRRTGLLRFVVKADRTLRLGRGLVVVAFIVAMFSFGWMQAVRSLTGDVVLIDEAIALLPPLAGVLTLWWGYSPIDEHIHDVILLRRLDSGVPTPLHAHSGGYIADRVRHQALLTLIPIGLIASWSEGVGILSQRFSFEPDSALDEAVFVGFNAVGVFAALLILPMVIVRVWKTTPLSGGPIRERLDALCNRHRVRCRNILVWRTRSGMLNAAVMGLVRHFRFILLTDELLERLAPEQIEAVMAHEVAHVRRAHLVWLLLALLATIGLLSTGVDAIIAMVPEEAEVSVLVTDGLGVGLVLIAGLLVFGFVSRRFERQADAFATQHLSGLTRGEPRTHAHPITHDAVRAMAEALLHVAHLNHSPVERFTWRHGSIAGRVGAIRRLEGLRIGDVPIDRTVRALKAAIALAILALVVLTTLESVGTR